MAKSRRQTHARRTGNLFTIDAEAVEEAKQFSSRSLTSIGSCLDDSIHSTNHSFTCDRFEDLPPSSERPSILVSSMRSSSSRKQSLLSVSFAESETVHVVDSLKHCLNKDEKQELWETAPENNNSSSSSDSSLSPLESALYEAFCLDDSLPLPASGRNDNKRRRRKTQSKLRSINSKYAAAMQSPSKVSVKKTSKLSPISSPMDSLTSRLGFRNRQRMHSNILIPLH